MRRLEQSPGGGQRFRKDTSDGIADHDAPATSEEEHVTRLRLTVLRGGPSTEREISLLSGGAVAAACRRLGHDVTEADISPADLGALDIPADLVFPVLHGRFGEDGQLQEILDKRGICYVGSDAAASRIGMDKDACKQVWRQSGLPTAPWLCAGPDTTADDLQTLKLPVVVKPIDEGSSLGVHFANDRPELERILGAEETRERGKVIVEERLSGFDLTVGILGRNVLPIIEIRPATSFYAYDAKYLRDDTEYLFDLDLPAGVYDSIQQIAQNAFDVIGARDLARVDVINDERLGPQLLEINTIPGFTEHSLLPKAALRAGISFDQMIDRLISLAINRCGQHGSPR
jgi:D-alanine-D-alanine ligase